MNEFRLDKTRESAGTVGIFSRLSGFSKLRKFWILLIFSSTVTMQVFADDLVPFRVVESDISRLSLDELMKQRSELHRNSMTASRVVETIRDAPASMEIVDSRTIKRRGYDSVDDILASLPGFDTIVTNGTMQTVAYQRGYRTPWTQRTLFLVNGKSENNLWNHSAQISRQYPMTMIDRVEVLHGPAGAVYGPNAFLGVINVVTKNSSRLMDGEHRSEARLTYGSFNSRGVDVSVGGREGNFSYDFGLKLYDSDEAGIEDYAAWGYTDPSLLSDPSIWGPGIGEGVDPVTGDASPIGDIDLDGTVESEELIRGRKVGQYSDPTSNYGFIGEARFGDWELGLVKWKTNEGYGPYYSFADGQPGSSWIHESTQLYLNNERELSDSMSMSTEVVLRSNRIGGNWIESFGDNVSISEWNSYNEAYRIEMDFVYEASSQFSLRSGIRHEHRDLAKLYEICNYWDGSGICVAQAANSLDGFSSDGSGVIPASLISSENPTPLPPVLDGNYVPDFNLNHSQDYGAYVQGIWEKGDLRFNTSLRWDENSDYKSILSPRIAIIYHQSPQASFKLAYGEAFQEPSPKDLFGGWNGRRSNMDLRPERARNLEFIATRQSERIVHDASFFLADYRDVIAGSENVDGRNVFGFEYKGKFRIPNFLENSSDISGSLYYTYTNSRSGKQYNNVTSSWESMRGETGDIAPHKVNLAVNIPVRKNWIANSWRTGFRKGTYFQKIL
jgi:iron complex outermembrane receptor protein